MSSKQDKYMVALNCPKRGDAKGFVHGNSPAEARVKAIRLYDGWKVIEVLKEPDNQLTTRQKELREDVI